MKKGNRVLAFFLAVAMVFTSIAWDFNEAKAEETTDAITTTDDGVSINFDNIDVTTLDAAGYTSTKFTGEKAVAGEVNRPVSEHWFSDDGEDTPYGDVDASTIKGKNTGLKSNDLDSDNIRTYMYTPYSYEDFQVSAEIYYGAWSGIVFGEKNVCAKDEQTATSVAVFFNNGILNIVGAVDISTTKILRGAASNIDKGSAKNGRLLGFNNGSKADISGHVGGVYTVNVRKTGDFLFVWITGGAGLIRIKLAETYKTGYIGIQSDYYDSDGGGFKSLKVDKIKADETHILKTQTMEQLDDQGYFASVGSTSLPASQKSTSLFDSVGRAFYVGTQGKDYTNTSTNLTSGNDGVKTRASGTSIGALNIPYIYKNFRLKVTMYHGQVIGAALGPDSSTPVTSGTPSGISVYFNNGVIETFGKIDNSKGTGGAKSGTYMYKLTPTDGNANAFAPTRDETVCTMVIEVKNGILKTWLEGYSGYASVPIASGFSIEKISLIARNKTASPADKGGFISYTITNLDAGDSGDFDNVNLSNLDAAGYTASKSSAASTTSTVSTHWFSGYTDTYNAETETYANVGLKSKNNDSTNSNSRILNIPQVYDNFRLEANVYPGQVLGVQIGAEEKGVQVGSGTDTSGSVSIYINGSYLAVAGAIDYASRYGTTAGQNGFIQYTPTGNKTTWNKNRTLIIEVQDDILSVSYADLDHVLKVKLASSYKTENIALFARRYSTNDKGEAGGGFKGYSIEKLPNTNNIGTTVDIAGYTSFDQVDVSELDTKGFSATQYSSADNAYSVVGENQPVETYMFAGEVGVNASGEVVVDENLGLKSKSKEANSKMTVLNTPYMYKNFRMSTEVYWGSYTGIVLGEKNVYPTSKIDTGVVIYFNANQLQLGGGGVDYNTSEVSGSATWNAASAPTYIFKPASSYTAKEGAVYTLNVELNEDVLTVWLDGCDGVLTIKTSDNFKSECIGLVSRQYDGQGGGLKSVAVNSLDDSYINFDNIDVTKLDNANYTSSILSTTGTAVEGESDKKPSEHWFSGNDYSEYTSSAVASANEGIKAKTLDTSDRYIMYAPCEYENFKISAEIYYGAYSGIIIGEKNVYPTTGGSATGVAIFFNGGNTHLQGAVDYNSMTIEGTDTAKSNNGVAKGYAIFNNGAKTTINASIGKVFTLNVEKKDNLLTVWISGYDSYMTIELTDTYKNGAIGILSRGCGTDRGGFKSLSINEIETLSKVYTPSEFASYRTATNSDGTYTTLPEYNDYLFAGWFYDEACTQNVEKDVTKVAKPVYAKFVSTDILTVKAQISASLEDEKSNNDETGEIRFITTVDSLKYSKVGFVIAYDKDRDGVDTPVSFSSGEVYKELYAVGSSDGEAMTYYPYEEFCPSSVYFKACTVRKIGQDYYDMDFTVTPFWITSDGTRVEGEVAVKSIDERWVRNAVYISDSGSNDTGLGTPTRPYSTLNTGIAKVANGGTVYVTDTCTIAAGDTWKAHNKSVTISGTQDNSTSVLQVADDWTQTFCIKDSVTFDNITFKLLSSTYRAVYAEGNSLTINSDVVVEGVKEIYGGSRDSVVESTDLKVYAGTYEKIFAGSNSKEITGNTNLVVGGNVNKDASKTTSWSNHDHVYMIFGGSEKGTVKGNTNVTVESGAEAIYVYGGGRSAGSQVLGSTNVNFAGKAMSIYGGSGVGNNNAVGGTSSDTNVIITGGEVAQLFGGSESTSITGNVNVQVLGGTVTRRIYGGCYNDYDSKYWSLENMNFWGSDNHVTGYTNVTIGAGATINVNSGTETGFLAVSRYEDTFADEKSTVVFKDGIDLSSKLKCSSSFVTKQAYNYLVKGTTNGDVVAANGLLYVTPENGYKATVTYGNNNTEIIANSDGTYSLPELPSKDSQYTIQVTFSK